MICRFNDKDGEGTDRHLKENACSPSPSPSLLLLQMEMLERQVQKKMEREGLGFSAEEQFSKKWVFATRNFTDF